MIKVIFKYSDGTENFIEQPLEEVCFSNIRSSLGESLYITSKIHAENRYLESLYTGTIPSSIEIHVRDMVVLTMNTTEESEVTYEYEYNQVMGKLIEQVIITLRNQ